MTQGFGNHYPKYASANPVTRWLMRGFLRDLLELCRLGPTSTILEAGCGEGHLAGRVTAALSPRSYLACDLPAEVAVPSPVQYQQASIYNLPFPDAHFELVLACEVLEHLEDPRLAMLELSRVARHAVIVSTPREPLWRALNLARGSYIRQAGNTPGHIQHFSRSGLWELCQPYLEDLCDRRPTPWTLVRGRPRR